MRCATARRRRDPRRRPGRADASRSSCASASRRIAVTVIERRAHPVPRGGAQGRRIDGGDRRALFRARAGPARAPGRRADPQVRLPLFLLRRPRRHRALHRARRQPAAADADAGRSTAASSRTSSASRRARSASTSATARWCAASTSTRTARPSRSRSSTTAQHDALDARWVVDASGRAGLLKRKLGLAEANGHDANAVWLRIDGSRRSDRLVRRRRTGCGAAIRRIAGARPTTCAARATGSG